MAVSGENSYPWCTNIDLTEKYWTNIGSVLLGFKRSVTASDRGPNRHFQWFITLYLDSKPCCNQGPSRKLSRWGSSTRTRLDQTPIYLLGRDRRSKPTSSLLKNNVLAFILAAAGQISTNSEHKRGIIR